MKLPTSPPMSRRTFFGLSGSGLLVAACGGGNDGDDVSRAADRIFAPEILVADGTPQRSVWTLSDEQGNLADDAPASIGVSVATGEGEVLHEDTATAHRDGVALPYYPVWTEFPSPGEYEFRFDTSFGPYAGFATVSDRASNPLLRPGDAFPSLVTPTVDNAAGVDPICTRSPVCPFHAVSLDTVLTDGSPTVILVSSPAFCSIGYLCGPTLELLIEEAERVASGTTIIHSEVYAAPTPQLNGEVAPLVAATRATYEPFLFVLDGQGTVVHRLDHIWDRAELKDALALTA